MYELESRFIKFPSSKFGSVVPIKTMPGHFATANAHINCYIDLTTIKSRASEARDAAHAMAMQYTDTTIVDTIVCLESMSVIGAYLAEELPKAGIVSYNLHHTIYVAKPELLPGNQLLFRDNMQMMLKDKNVILLVGNVTTGINVSRGLECIAYYGGKVVGISSIFSASEKTVSGIPIHALFTADDIGYYEFYSAKECPLCKRGVPIEAMVNHNGYSKI